MESNVIATPAEEGTVVIANGFFDMDDRQF
jgi:hypothetical protein